ncbi:MAG: hypothetical protein G01um101429_924 [Parcubacteria group bacterium Gr01-1014_29]|nr:MAG: hypothetical protein G01um101429_924 [Parcubacteria group bacterium Gr01-1014_29]
MRKSTKKEIQEVTDLVLDTRARIEELLQNGKKVHIIWDFDGILVDSRSDDVFALTEFNLEAYFTHEERLLFQSPDRGLWLLPIAHNVGSIPRFPPERFTQDIVTTRSSTLSIRVHMFCLAWNLSIRWILFLGHQPKQGSYRIILESLKDDLDYYIFCIDDNTKHVEAFKNVSIEMGLDSRTFGIVSPIVRTYTKKGLKKYFDRVMNAVDNTPLRVRDPSDDMHGFLILPGGLKQFKANMSTLVNEQQNSGHYFELRNAFVRAFGEVGTGHFKTDDDLNQAMHEFISGLLCP